jgi:hypothetical protein
MDIGTIACFAVGMIVGKILYYLWKTRRDK